MNIKSNFLVISALTLATSVIGCGAADNDTEFAATQEALFGGAAFYDAGSQCTVSGKTMHCCPIVNGNPSVMIGAHIGQNLFKCRELGPAAGNRLIDTSFLDTSTQRNGMHACPLGSLMRGLRVDQNLLTCVYPQHAIISGDDFVDTGSQDGVMHVCGSNGKNVQYAMSGIRVDQNRFTCDSDGESN